MESLGGLDDATKNTEDTVVSLEEKKVLEDVLQEFFA